MHLKTILISQNSDHFFYLKQYFIYYKRLICIHEWGFSGYLFEIESITEMQLHLLQEPVPVHLEHFAKAWVHCPLHLELRAPYMIYMYSYSSFGRDLYIEHAVRFSQTLLLSCIINTKCLLHSRTCCWNKVLWACPMYTLNLSNGDASKNFRHPNRCKSSIT